ncbi:MAG: Uma2 family endonuclease [Dehalococcoidia bacterium]
MARAPTRPPGPLSNRRPSRRRTYTPEQFLQLESEAGFVYELDDAGYLEERHLGQQSDEVAMAIVAALFAYAGGRGRVFGGGTGLQIFPDRPRRIPRCDAAYISFARLPDAVKGHLRVPPELAVEVVSPGDNASVLERKVQEYLGAAVLRVWVVYPDEKTVTVRRPDGTSTILGVNDEISGEDAVPGFSARVADFFPG